MNKPILNHGVHKAVEGCYFRLLPEVDQPTDSEVKTLYLPCAWLGYIDYQCVTDSETIWEINHTLSGYGVKISEFVEITEDQPFMYDYNNSGYPTPCYEYTFKVSEIVNHNSHCINALDSKLEVIETTDPINLDTTLGQRTALFNDLVFNQLKPLLDCLQFEYSIDLLPHGMSEAIDNLLETISNQ